MDDLALPIGRRFRFLLFGDTIPFAFNDFACMYDFAPWFRKIKMAQAEGLRHEFLSLLLEYQIGPSKADILGNLYFPRNEEVRGKRGEKGA